MTVVEQRGRGDGPMELGWEPKERRMTTTTVFQTCPVPGEADLVAEAFRGDPGQWLPQPAEDAGLERWLLRLDVGRFSRPVLASVGPPWQLGEMTWRVLSWEPLGEDGESLPLDRVLPVFHGEIGLREVDSPTLVMQGAYDPPLGRMGRQLDSALLHRLADRTVRELVVAVAKRLSEENLVTR